MSVRLRVCDGTPENVSGGFTFAPSQVQRVGIVRLCSNAGLVIVILIPSYRVSLKKKRQPLARHTRRPFLRIAVANFSLRSFVQLLISASRRRAFDSDRLRSCQTSVTGRQVRVYFAPLPALCATIRSSRRFVMPVYKDPFEQRRMYTTQDERFMRRTKNSNCVNLEQNALKLKINSSKNT